MQNRIWSTFHEEKAICVQLVVQIREEKITSLTIPIPSGWGLGQIKSDPCHSWGVPRLFSCHNANSGLLDPWICSASKEQETSGEEEAFSEASAISRGRKHLANKALPTRQPLDDRVHEMLLSKSSLNLDSLRHPQKKLSISGHWCKEPNHLCKVFIGSFQLLKYLLQCFYLGYLPHSGVYPWSHNIWRGF